MPPTLALLLSTFLICFDVATGLNNGLAKTPPRGFSTWNAWPDNRKPAHGNSITEELARTYMNGVVAAGLNGVGYEYFIIDEPCFIGRDVNGKLMENSTTWPNGLAKFSQELKSHGMKLGIYTCVGPTTCGGCVASEGHEDQDMQTFVDWGAEYVKVDSCSRNCTKAAGVPNATTCGQTLWTRYTEALNKTGKPVVYSIIGNLAPGRGESPWKWAADFANSWRTNIDIQIGFQSVPYIIDCQRRLSGNGTWCPTDPHNPNGPGSPCGGVGGPEQYSAPGHWNDMDMLIIGTKSVLFPDPLNAAQSRAQLSMWTILKSPLLASADFNNVSQELIDILKNEEVLAISDDPLGIEASRLEDKPGSKSVGEIYVGKTSKGFAAVMFNRQGTAQNMTLVLEDFVPTTPTSNWNIRNLWTHTDVGVLKSTDSFQSSVSGDDVVMITIEPSTTMIADEDVNVSELQPGLRSI